MLTVGFIRTQACLTPIDRAFHKLNGQGDRRPGPQYAGPHQRAGGRHTHPDHRDQKGNSQIPGELQAARKNNRSAIFRLRAEVNALK